MIGPDETELPPHSSGPTGFDTALTVFFIIGVVVLLALVVTAAVAYLS